MDILIKVLQLITALSILVIVHEWGHFIAARMFGIKVEKFYLFFDAWGFKLFKFKKGETEYGIGWLPLGGYVKIAGMIDESMDKKFLDTEPESWEFRSKPVWQRMIVILGGIIMNVILGVLIFTLHTWYYGQTFIPEKVMQQNGIVALSLAQKAGLQTGDIILSINDKKLIHADDILRNSNIILDKNVDLKVRRNGEIKHIIIPDNFGKMFLEEGGADNFIKLRTQFKVGVVSKGSLAEKSGLQPNDVIIAINDKEIKFFDEFKDELAKNKNKEITLKVTRNTEVKELKAQLGNDAILGFLADELILNEIDTLNPGLASSFSTAVTTAISSVADNVKGLSKVIKGDLPAKKTIQGPLGIMQVYGSEWDWYRFWKLTALLSMVLAFMNFLPIPALDGGYLIFLIVELFRGKPASYRVLEVAQMVGMGIIFLLMGFAFYNDISNMIK